jgi:hypothetical protein
MNIRLQVSIKLDIFFILEGVGKISQAWNSGFGISWHSPIVSFGDRLRADALEHAELQTDVPYGARAGCVGKVEPKVVFQILET